MIIHDYIWRKTYENKYLIILSSNLKEDDFRLKKWDNSYYSNDECNYNDYNICKRNYIKDDGFYINYKKKQLQYNIYKRNENFNEINEINIFNLKSISNCLGIFIKSITLSINDDIKFHKFKILKDDYFKEKYKNYLLIYNNLYDFYIKTDSYDFEILYEKHFNYTYLKLKYNSKTNKLYEFINKFDNTIKEIIGDFNNYISIIKKDNSIKMKVKNNIINPGFYKNNTIYIKCNRLYTIKDKNQWGISLVVDKIINNT